MRYNGLFLQNGENNFPVKQAFDIASKFISIRQEYALQRRGSLCRPA